MSIGKNMSEHFCLKKVYTIIYMYSGEYARIFTRLFFDINFATRSQSTNKLKLKNMEKEEYMTVKEAADYLKLSVGYLYKLMMWKKVPYYKPFGNRCYFKPRELAELMGANKSYTADELQAQAMAYTLKKNN